MKEVCKIKKIVTIKQNFRCLKMRRESKPIKCRLSVYTIQ